MNPFDFVEMFCWGVLAILLVVFATALCLGKD